MTNLDPIALTLNGPHRTWWRVGSAIVLAIGVLVAFGSSNGNLDLDVKRGNIYDIAADGKLLMITNVGRRPVTITKVVVNERPDCQINANFPVELKIGEQRLMASGCHVIRVEIDAKEGTETYEFGG
jgi:hypothetical protein